MNGKYMKKLIIFAAAVFLIAGCASMGGGDSGANTLATGNHSNMKDQTYSDIHNQADFDAMWNKAFAKLSGAPDKPVVDFSKDMVISAFAGDQPTGGYTLRIKNIDTTGDNIQVTILVTQPGNDCHHPQGATDPFLIAAIPASTKPVSINPTYRKAPDCG